jgi:hypothetical protein
MGSPWRASGTSVVGTEYQLLKCLCVSCPALAEASGSGLSGLARSLQAMPQPSLAVSAQSGSRLSQRRPRWRAESFGALTCGDLASQRRRNRLGLWHLAVEPPCE